MRSWKEAKESLTLLETFGVLSARHVRNIWRCWKNGSGGGNIEMNAFDAVQNLEKRDQRCTGRHHVVNDQDVFPDEATRFF